VWNSRSARGNRDCDDLQCDCRDGTIVLDSSLLGAITVGESLHHFCSSPTTRSLLIALGGDATEIYMDKNPSEPNESRNESKQRSLITTYLEMRSADQLRTKRADARFEVREKTERDWRFNRDLYFRVGEQWDWIDKRLWTDNAWKEYAMAPKLRTFAGYYDG